MSDIDPRVKLSPAAAERLSRLNAPQMQRALRALTSLADTLEQGLIHVNDNNDFFSDAPWADSKVFCKEGIRIIYGFGQTALEIDWFDFDPPPPCGGGKSASLRIPASFSYEFEVLPVLFLAFRDDLACPQPLSPSLQSREHCVISMIACNEIVVRDVGLNGGSRSHPSQITTVNAAGIDDSYLPAPLALPEAERPLGQIACGFGFHSPFSWHASMAPAGATVSRDPSRPDVRSNEDSCLSAPLALPGQIDGGGSGATGLPAAVVALEAGASIIVVEAENHVGGHAITSGGNLPLGGGFHGTLSWYASTAPAGATVSRDPSWPGARGNECSYLPAPLALPGRIDGGGGFHGMLSWHASTAPAKATVSREPSRLRGEEDLCLPAILLGSFDDWKSVAPSHGIQ